ncbi:MAG: hypothetical protein MUF16_10205 [Burkholderiaceae bacterium]|nr:hypothetical protein [Burkholderiaceae bacterium]
MGTAVQDAARSAQIRPHQHRGDDAVGVDLDELHAHQAGQQGLQALLQGVSAGDHGASS